MSNKLTQLDRILSFNGMLKLGKESYFYLIISIVHLFFIVMFAIFVSMFINTDYAYDYIRAYFSKEFIIFSNAVNLDLVRTTILDTYYIKAIKQAGYFLCFTTGLYTISFLFINKQVRKFVKMLSRDGENKDLSGTVILKDNEFISKYISLRKNDKEGIFISQVYEFKEVDRNGNIKEF